MSFVVPESETPETDKEEAELDMARGIMEERGVNELPVLKKKIVRSTFARSLERRLSLAQTEIKGHMRVKDDSDTAYESVCEAYRKAQARIAELEKDAARYRWLRQWANRGDELAALNLKEPETPEDIDAAIDAALKDRA